MIPSIHINANDFISAKSVELEFLSGSPSPLKEIWQWTLIELENKPPQVIWVCIRSDIFTDHLTEGKYLFELIDLIKSYSSFDLIKNYSPYQLCSIHYKY